MIRKGSVQDRVEVEGELLRRRHGGNHEPVFVCDHVYKDDRTRTWFLDVVPARRGVTWLPCSTEHQFTHYSRPNRDGSYIELDAGKSECARCNHPLGGLRTEPLPVAHRDELTVRQPTREQKILKDVTVQPFGMWHVVCRPSIRKPRRFVTS